jgi:hypothetical protein
MAHHTTNPCAGCGADMGPGAFDDFCDVCRLEANVPQDCRDDEWFAGDDLDEGAYRPGHSSNIPF